MLTQRPPARQISATGARYIARQIRELVWDAHEEVLSRIGIARGCPFDLNALVPVPWSVLRLGFDDPAAIAWLWQHWGTTWPLRRVELHDLPPRKRAAVPPAHVGCEIRFFSADWSPWPVLRECRRRWPALRFDLAVEYWWGIEDDEARAKRRAVELGRKRRRWRRAEEESGRRFPKQAGA